MNERLMFFLLGFRASREGFNGECAFDHLAPPNMTHERSEADLLEFEPDADESDAELLRLFDEASRLIPTSSDRNCD